MVIYCTRGYITCVIKFQIKRIENDANEIEQEARAQAALTESVAKANSSAILEGARGQVKLLLVISSK